MTPLEAYYAFDGIGGFRLGLGRAGIGSTGGNEIVPHRQTILDRHWPGHPLGGDIRYVRGSDVGRPGVMVGGFPCEDTSIAAPHRRGLDGARSGLFYEFMRLVDDYLALVEYSESRWVLMENTPGLLKSRGGRDMAAVVMGLEQLGYGWAYRVVDGLHFPAAGRLTGQRRPRLLLVGHSGGDPRPAGAVLGLPGTGLEVAAPSGIGGVPRQGGPRPVGDPADAHGAVIWRKSARARAALDKGGYETWVQAEHSNTLTGFDGGLATRQTHLIAQAGRLRTLTLTEWERLSGFPDGWTAGIPDSERYHALGDCFHVGTAEWLGRRLVAVHNALPLLEVA